MAKDPYHILGVGKSADEAAIKSAYRKLAKKYHPDLNPGQKESERFKEISAAYNLLSDKDKRAAFDRGDIDMEGQPQRQSFYRDHAQGPQGQRYYQFNQGNGGGGFEDFDLSDLFGSFFKGGGAKRASPPPPQDVQYRIDIDFVDAVKGGSRRITLPDGRALNVTIPAGVEEGQQLRLKGQGGKSADGRAGDAYIEVHIRPHAVFTRKGNDIYSDVPVGFHESILGEKIEVETIHGPVEVTLPKGASGGATLRLKGKGIGGGSHFIKLRIVMPPAIDSDLETAVRDWAKAHGYNPRKQKASAS